MHNLLITTEKTVSLTENVLEQIRLEHDDFKEDHEGGLTFLTIDEEMEFLPVDFYNESKMHFTAWITIECIWKHDEVQSEQIEIRDIKAFDVQKNEVSLTEKQYNTVETLIDNAIIL